MLAPPSAVVAQHRDGFLCGLANNQHTYRAGGGGESVQAYTIGVQAYTIGIGNKVGGTPCGIA